MTGPRPRPERASPRHPLRIVLLAQCITERCIARRDNARYLSAAGRKKALNLGAYLRALGHDVLMLSSSYARCTDGAWTEEVAAGLEIRHTPTLGLARRHTLFKRTVTTCFNLWELWARRRDTDMIVIYNYHIEFALPALVLSCLVGMPVVLDYEDGLFLDRGYRTRMYRLLERWVYRRCSGFLLVNPGLRERIELIGQRPVDPQRIGVIHGYFNAGQLRALQPSPGTHDELLFAGNYSRGFGFDELRRYIAALPAGYGLTVCGRAGSEEEQAIRSLCEASKGARHLGYVTQDRLQELTQRARAVILLNDVTSPFNNTNFPSKLFDYLSNGKTVLCTRNPLLSRYAGLSNLLTIDSIEQDLGDLRHRLLGTRFVADEIRALDDEIRAELARVLTAATSVPAHGAP